MDREGKSQYIWGRISSFFSLYTPFTLEIYYICQGLLCLKDAMITQCKETGSGAPHLHKEIIREQKLICGHFLKISNKNTSPVFLFT